MEQETQEAPVATESARDSLVNGSVTTGEDFKGTFAAPESGTPAAPEESAPPVTAPPQVQQTVPQTPSVDWKKRYDDLRRSQSQAQRRQRFAPQTGQQQTAQPAAQAAPPPATPENDWYGYGSQDLYEYMLEKKPQDVGRKVLEWGVRNNSAFIEELVEKKLHAMTAPDREIAFIDHLKTRGTDFSTRYPEAQPGAPLYDAWTQWMHENILLGNFEQDQETLRVLSDAMPEVNLSEMGFKMATYDILKQENEALKKRLGETARTAVTAQPAGGRAVPKGHTHEAIGEQVLEEARQKGLKVDPDEVGAFTRAMERVMPNFGKRKKTA